MGNEKEGGSVEPEGFNKAGAQAQSSTTSEELVGLRRQRGTKRASVTRIRKFLEIEIERHASRDDIQDLHGRLKDAFGDLRRIHQLYEALVVDQELEEAHEYADRLEEEESIIRGKVQQYLQHLKETQSLASASRRSLSRAASRASKETVVSARSKEAAVELDDADRKLQDMRVQFEEEHRIRLERLKMEERRQQEQLDMEKRRRQEEMELEEREIAS
ncbi:GRB10-interacting GYF protein 2-like [Amphibalanus amphitrite]|uniref:GRB10-interacting GYF protein 2-like n=1 Tax=Amphibalanus amphitrite TaxID=1232801 RepID=UPI001C9043DA|nr:GRB10-interacting GYF protein 2-like [Amphibalanus amphitrite]